MDLPFIGIETPHTRHQATKTRNREGDSQPHSLTSPPPTHPKEDKIKSSKKIKKQSTTRNCSSNSKEVGRTKKIIRKSFV